MPNSHVAATYVTEVTHICFGAWVLNFTVFHFTTTRLQVTGHFETSAPNDTKMTLNLTRSKVPKICVSMSPKFHPVPLYDQQFSRYMIFWDKSTERPTMALESYKATRTSCVLLVLSPNFIPLCSMTNHFRDTCQSETFTNVRRFCSKPSCCRVSGHFQTNAPNDPKMS